MKVLHIINDLNNGGAERLLVDILPLLKKRDHMDVSVLQLSDRNSLPHYINSLKQAGVAVHALTKGTIYHPQIVPLLRKFIKLNDYDIVHVHLFPAMYYVAIAGLGMKNKFVFTEHSTQNRRWNKSYLRLLEKSVYNRYNKIISISPAIEKKLIEWTGLRSKISLIRNGVNTEKFKEAQAYTKEEISSFLGISPSVKMMLMTARFIYPKDHITVMNSLQYLPEDYHVLFAGGAGDVNQAIEFSRKAGISDRVHFLGFRNDIPKLMKSVDVNILSSWYEGMSGVACEALAAGKPFLGSDVPGINDVVPDDRYLFEVQNAKDLAQKIQRVTKNSEMSDTMVLDGIHFVKQFDIHRMLDGLSGIYTDVVTQKQ